MSRQTQKLPLLFQFMNEIISRLKSNGQLRTAETYTATLRSFRSFRKGRDLPLALLSPEMMEEYQAWHLKRGNRLNTVSFYTRILRAVYHRAVESGLVNDLRPFRHVYTGVAKTVKRALPLPVIRKIKNLELSGDPHESYARDMFMLSFYLRGMSFIDMAFLRKTDLRNGYISYRRRKTGQELHVAWTAEMQSILDRYPANPTCYLLPIIRSEAANERNTYRNAAYNINHNLKNIGRKLNLSVPLTLYVSRHSWASIARDKGIPLAVISEGLGHDSEHTTAIYLSSLSAAAVDRANAMILRSI